MTTILSGRRPLVYVEDEISDLQRFVAAITSIWPAAPHRLALVCLSTPPSDQSDSALGQLLERNPGLVVYARWHDPELSLPGAFHLSGVHLKQSYELAKLICARAWPGGLVLQDIRLEGLHFGKASDESGPILAEATKGYWNNEESLISRTLALTPGALPDPLVWLVSKQQFYVDTLSKLFEGPVSGAEAGGALSVKGKDSASLSKEVSVYLRGSLPLHLECTEAAPQSLKSAVVGERHRQMVASSVDLLMWQLDEDHFEISGRAVGKPVRKSIESMEGRFWLGMIKEGKVLAEKGVTDRCTIAAETVSKHRKVIRRNLGWPKSKDPFPWERPERSYYVSADLSRAWTRLRDD